MKIRNLLLHFGILMIVVAGFSTAAAQTAQVWTDKTDYLPGEIAMISGSGWWSGESISIHISSTHAAGNYYLKAIADEQGAFSNLEFPIYDYHYGEEFILMAFGDNSDLYAETFFTDGPQLKGINPLSGSALGGNDVILYGEGFDKNRTISVAFGTAEPVTPHDIANNGKEIKVKAPQHPAGTVKVVVSVSANSGGQGGGSTKEEVFYTFIKENQTINFTTLPTKIYGDTPFPLTATSTSGLPVTFSSSNTQVAIVSGSDVTIVGAGVTTITASQDGNGFYNPAMSVEQILTINQRAITITADAKSKIYGEDDEALTYQITAGSIVAGDQPSGALSRVAGENVGSYAIGKNTFTYGANYAETFAGADYTITPRAITITADAKSKIYGEDDEPLTYQVTAGSIVNGDQPSGALSRAAGENVGTYAIGKNTFTFGTNYAETFAGADYTITHASASVAYTGARLLATTGETRFELSARIESLSGASLLGEQVRFTVKWNNNANQWSTIVTIGTEGTTAIVNAVYEFTLPSGEASRQLTIDTEVIKNFQGDDKGVIAIVYRPNGDHITGGGYIVAGEKSLAGEVKPNIASNANFGFVFRYQQKGKDLVLHGEANLVVRQENDTYTFKAIEALSMGIYDNSAQFSAKVEMRVNNESSPRYTNLLMYATLEDHGTPGTRDLIGFTIWNGNDLIYSSHWEGSYTRRDNLGGGNLVIHRGGTTATADPTFELREVNNILMDKKIAIFPNPFRERVNIQFIPATSERAVVSIYNITGSLVETLYDGLVEEGQEYKLQFVPAQNNSQVLFYRITIGNKTETGRIIQQR
jgi:uncharacterized ubiquitin-like protein YukD